MSRRINSALQPSMFDMQRAYQREQERLHQAPQACEKCGAHVVWIQMGPTQKGKPGGRMICDPGWQYGDGRKNLVVLYEGPGKTVLGKMIVRAGEEVRGFEPHWGSCPHREHFRKPNDRSAKLPANVIPLHPR